MVKRMHASILSIHRALLLIVVALLAVAIAPIARAQDDRSVVVTRRDGEITILQNGDVNVVETWQTQFIGGPFRFAFRSIPLDRVEAISDWGVSEGGVAYRQGSDETPRTFKLERNGNEQRITWYFEPTRDAARTFTLRYTLQGALRIYPDGDQFFWKFIEADRGYPINDARVIVRLPGTFDPSHLLATTYRNTREEQGGAQILDGSTAQFVGQNFSGGTEWEIRVQFPHGVVPSEPPAWQAADDARRAEEAARLARQPFYNLIALVAAMVTLIGGGLGVYLLWYTRGRDHPVSGVAPYYTEPPEDVPPGLVGTLLDERADMQDILATLIDLARRGYLQIVEHKPSGFWNVAPRDFTFVRGDADPNQLRPFERRLYDKIFGMTINERDLSSLKDQFYTEVSAIQNDLYEETVRMGYFDRKPNVTRNLYTGLAIVVLIFTVGLGIVGSALLFDYAPLFPLVVVAAGIVGIALLIVSRSMSRKTEVGARAAAKWNGFKRYLANLERYTEVERAKDQFERYLPYAIAFGLEREWVRRFERVDTPAPPWYYPYGMPMGRPVIIGSGGSGGPARGGSFGGSGGSGGGMPSLDQAAGRAFGGLNAMSAGLFGMLNTAATTFTSVPQSQSGSGSFGGGGFSGGFGGGGGGGGGSSGFG